MSDSTLLSILRNVDEDTTANCAAFMAYNEYYLDRYEGNPYGNEVPERSSVMSNDAMDLVESDMPSMARVFLGSGQVIKFEAGTSQEQDIQEAEDKTKYVDHLVRKQPWSFAVLHNWIKDAEIQKMGVLKYFYSSKEEIEEREFKGINELELVELLESLKTKYVTDIETVDTTDNEDGTFDISFKVTRQKTGVEIVNVTTENFKLSRNASSLDDAFAVGDDSITTRGDLLALGYKRSLVEKIPTFSGQDLTSNLPEIRSRDQGGSYEQTQIDSWASENVCLEDRYLNIDYDGDGIAEARRILKSGDIILENEVFNHRPYAMMSAMLMPHQAIGKGRVELVAPTQEIKTELLRGTVTNSYFVSEPMVGINENVNKDDLMNPRPGGVVRNKGTGQPGQNMFPVQIPYIGDKSLQVIQYMDQARAQTTGSLMSNQGLSADEFEKETATRFNGVEAASNAKIELCVRVMAETGWAKLYQGVAWLVTHFQDNEAEFAYLGKPLTSNPQKWVHESNAVPDVGLGAGDADEVLNNMGALFSIHQQLKAGGSPLTDDKKIYNIVSKMANALGVQRVDQMFNDPEQPDELILAENEQLKGMLAQMNQEIESLKNPLTEPALITAQAKLVEAQGKQELEIEKEREKQRQFNIEMREKMDQFDQNMLFKNTELEVESGKNIPGSDV